MQTILLCKASISTYCTFYSVFA